MKNSSLIQKVIIITSIWTLLVIALGAYTRLVDAGLGCPDWPGCYGHLTVPSSVTQPIQQHKAWSEMIHRYFAGTLGLLVFAVVVMGIRHVRKYGTRKQLMPFVTLFLLLLYQPILGMLTVTLQLMPIIVTQHLLVGMSILGILTLCYLVVTHPAPVSAPIPLSRWALFGTILLFAQLALGAWTSTNYAAIVCNDFPFCQLAHWKLNFHEAFKLTLNTGINYDGGLISDNAKRTIQMTHRVGALIIGLYWFVIASATLFRQAHRTRLVKTVLLLLVLLMAQVCLGIANVLLARPLLIAVAHNLTAALLFMTTIRFTFYCYRTPLRNT